MSFLHDRSQPHSEPGSTLGPLVVGVYALLAAVNFGITVIDIQYARVVPTGAADFSEVADFLLLASAATLLAAFGAVGVSWNASGTRNVLLASLLVGVSGLFAPVFLAPLISDGSGIGAGLRLLITGSTAALAFVGFYGASKSSEALRRI